MSAVVVGQQGNVVGKLEEADQDVLKLLQLPLVSPAIDGASLLLIPAVALSYCTFACITC